MDYGFNYTEEEKSDENCKEQERERVVYDTSDQDYAETDLDMPTDYSLKYR